MVIIEDWADFGNVLQGAPSKDRAVMLNYVCEGNRTSRTPVSLPQAKLAYLLQWTYTVQVTKLYSPQNRCASQ